jgi:hypothetical protein
MSGAYSPDDVVTVIRLVSLGRTDRQGTASAVVATVAQASTRLEGNSIFLVARNESAVRHIKVGDIVQWVAEPFGAVWLAEHRADGAHAAGGR